MVLAPFSAEFLGQPLETVSCRRDRETHSVRGAEMPAVAALPLSWTQRSQLRDCRSWLSQLFSRGSKQQGQIRVRWRRAKVRFENADSITDQASRLDLIEIEAARSTEQRGHVSDNRFSGVERRLPIDLGRLQTAIISLARPTSATSVNPDRRDNSYHGAHRLHPCRPVHPFAHQLDRYSHVNNGRTAEML